MLNLLALKGIKPEGFLKCSVHFPEGREGQPDEKVGRLPRQWEAVSDCRGILKLAINWKPVVSLTTRHQPSFCTRQGVLHKPSLGCPIYLSML